MRIEARSMFVPRIVAYPMILPAGFAVLALYAISGRPSKWKECHSKSEVRALFRRNRPLNLGRNRSEAQIFATVEINDVRWLNLMGSFGNASAADTAVSQIVAIWPGVPEGTPRFGDPPGIDKKALRLFLFCGGLFVGCVSWGIFASIWRA